LAKAFAPLQNSMMHENGYHSTLVKLKDLHENPKVILFAVFGKECNDCRCRYGHTLFYPLMTRLCQWCVHQRLISNRVLYEVYGVYFCDILVEYNSKGGLLLKSEGKRWNHNRRLIMSVSFWL